MWRVGSIHVPEKYCLYKGNPCSNFNQNTCWRIFKFFWCFYYFRFEISCYFNFFKYSRTVVIVNLWKEWIKPTTSHILSLQRQHLVQLNQHTCWSCFKFSWCFSFFRFWNGCYFQPLKNWKTGVIVNLGTSWIDPTSRKYWAYNCKTWFNWTNILFGVTFNCCDASIISEFEIGVIFSALNM